MTTLILGKSQLPTYDGGMEEQIGARVRARLKELYPGTSQADFAAQVDSPADAFSRSLNGKRAFTATELVDIAGRLGISAHWFVTGEGDPFTVRYAGRHTFNQETKLHEPLAWSDAEGVLADVALAYVQAYGSGLPAAKRPLPRTAKEARARLASRGDSEFVRRLADHIEDEFGIDVVRIPRVDSGFALEVLGHRIILLGETGSWFYENWSLAHELAHLVKGELSERGDLACDDPAAERRANAFAAELLLPRAVVDQVAWPEASERDLGEFLWRTGVSTSALQKRFTALGIVPSATVASALEEKTQAVIGRALGRQTAQQDGIAHRMQDASARRFPVHLIATHRAGVAEGTLLPDTLGWMLGIDPESISLELAPALVPVDLDWLGDQFGPRATSD